MALLDLGKPKEAIQALQKAVQLDPKNSQFQEALKQANQKILATTVRFTSFLPC